MGLWRIPRWIRLDDEALERERARSAARDVLRPGLRLIVCGDSRDHAFVFGALDWLAHARHVGRLLVGDDPGAARLAAAWAECHGVECFEFSTEWEAFGADAESLRNAELLRAWPSGVVILGNSASEMTDLAATSGVPIWKPSNDVRRSL